MKTNNQIIATLDEIRIAINNMYGFHDDIPRINYGPCGVFAQIFYRSWNKLFKQKVRICFILTEQNDECDHIVVRLPSGKIYDGGIGIHTEDRYPPSFTILEMYDYNEELLEKWSYGLDRKYPRFCPDFCRNDVEKLVDTKLKNLHRIIGDDITKFK